MSEPNFRWMSYRLNSFLRYPEAARFRPPQLASSGFFSNGRDEEVTCYACGVIHINFQPGRSIRRAHMQRSPDCPLNVGGDTLQADDAAGVAEEVVPRVLPIPSPKKDPAMDNHLIEYFSREFQTKTVFNRSDPKRSGFKLLDAEGNRLRRYTFYDWPGHYGDWEQLASRGFFYTGTEDTVQCCMCSIRYRARVLLDQPGQRLCHKSCGLYF